MKKISVALEHIATQYLYSEIPVQKFPSNIHILLGCTAFWNKEAEDVYKNNRAGLLGNERTQKYARETPFIPWLGYQMECDVKGLTVDTKQEDRKGWQYTYYDDPGAGWMLEIFNEKGALVLSIQYHN